MKKKIILYLAKSENPQNSIIASTLAWLAKSEGYLFDNYYDSYHQGVHFQGGDARNLETGQLTGGTVTGDRHFEEFYFLLLNFDVSIFSFKDTLFSSSIRNMNTPVEMLPEQINTLYKNIFSSIKATLPENIVMVCSDFGKSLAGINAYLYPEIYYRQALGVLDSIPEKELDDLYQDGGKIYCLYVDKNRISRLQKKGYAIEIIDQLEKDDDYFSITKRIALRWKDKVKGWILGDPTLVSHWLPKACEEDLLSIYSVPQEKIVTQLGDFISSKGKVVYGRQYSDRDFFELSKLNQCLQVIDPCRPPFQSVKHAEYSWREDQNEEGFYGQEYSDAELRQFAREGRVLVSLMFWSGMIREIANYYNLMDLFAMTRLKCGMILTSQSFEYMMHSPFELLTIPLEQGGVFPLVEPVLGSCGIGAGIESHIEKDRLIETINNALAKIFQQVKKDNYMPRGWWPTMDVDLEKLTKNEMPKPARFMKYSPYFQIRFHLEDKTYDEGSGPTEKNVIQSTVHYLVEKLKQAIRDAGLIKHFEPYRPYEFYGPGPLDKSLIDEVKTTGLQYMFTKAGFNEDPEAKYIDKNFMALNYTSGQWDGWTPFETVNDVSDLKKSEKKLLKSKKPGWIVSTIDSCLWTFSGEFWKKGSRLFDIAQFCASGGKSGALINVKPFTVARYARIIAENNMNQ